MLNSKFNAVHLRRFTILDGRNVEDRRRIATSSVHRRRGIDPGRRRVGKITAKFITENSPLLDTARYVVIDKFLEYGRRYITPLAIIPFEGNIEIIGNIWLKRWVALRRLVGPTRPRISNGEIRAQTIKIRT